MKPANLHNIIAHSFIALFIYTGLSNLADMGSLRLDLAASPFFYNISGVISWGITVAELSLAIVLLIPLWRLKGLYGSLILMIICTVYLLAVIVVEKHISCSCGGIVENLTTAQHLIFNIACIVFAGIGIKCALWQRSQSVNQKVQWTSTTVALLPFCLIVWILITAAITPTIHKTGREGTIIPAFNILLLDSATNINTKTISSNEPFIVVGFSPYCPHCRREITDILNNISKFNHTHIYLISHFPLYTLRNFNSQFEIYKYKNITLGADTSNAFLSYFDWHYIPFTTIYDSRRRLMEVISNRANIETLTRCLN